MTIHQGVFRSVIRPIFEGLLSFFLLSNNHPSFIELTCRFICLFLRLSTGFSQEKKKKQDKTQKKEKKEKKQQKDQHKLHKKNLWCLISDYFFSMDFSWWMYVNIYTHALIYSIHIYICWTFMLYIYIYTHIYIYHTSLKLGSSFLLKVGRSFQQGNPDFGSRFCSTLR